MKERSTSSEESLTQRLGAALHLKSYDIADNVGRELGDNRTPVHVVGLLCPDRFIEPPQNGVFSHRRFMIFPRKRRRLFFGTIWTNNILRGATADNWLFDVNDAADLPAAERLKDELERAFGVCITVKAVGNHPIGETFDRDKD